MEHMVIQGGRRLEGEIPIHGAKNSALPLLAATLLVPGISEIRNCPDLSDVRASVAILRHLGCGVEWEGRTVTVDATTLKRSDIPDALMREMRSSIVFLGAIVARCGEAVLTYPGGCELGPRPIDLHLAALRRLGVAVEEHHGLIRCRVERRLCGCRITLGFPSVGATENVLLAACTAEGVTVLQHAAREPEIRDLCGFLTACGCHISGDENGTLYIRGVAELHGTSYEVMPDRIETATYLAAGAVTGGELLLTGCDPVSTAPVFPALEQAGCVLTVPSSDCLHIRAPERLKGMGTVRTMPYPGFPTDAAAPLLAAACGADGTSIFVENIFENRYKYVDELARMGAGIRVDGRVAVVEGNARLQGAPVACTDLRGGAALVVAALAAQGETVITALHHLDRGYDDLVGGLAAAGGQIQRKQQVKRNGPYETTTHRCAGGA